MQIVIALLSAALAGGPGSGAASPVVTAVATDYHLTLPATLPAGPTWLRLANHGKEGHQLFLVRLEEGKTPSDFVAALKAGGRPPAWAVDAGGPNAVDPGRTSTTTVVNLTPGSYAALCIIPSPDGTPHVMKGMITHVEVTGARHARAATMPKTDDSIRLVDYGFEAARPLTAGNHILAVTNGGSQPHELVLARLHPGKSVSDLTTWTEKMAGPPPGEFLGGVSPIAPGKTNDLVVDLTPGRYALLCFLPDARDGKPHFVHGMEREITIP